MSKQGNGIDPRRRGSLPWVTAALAAAGLLNASVQAIETAGTLFVDADATQLPLGQLTNLPNAGETGGSFQAVGPQAAPPVVTLVGGTKGIDFDGTSFLKLADDTGTVIPTPDGLTGTDATASIEVWALNPSIVAEETLVSWGKRGGPEGSNLSFNYGNNGAFGAVGHWGNPDIGWKDAGGAPEANKWHHLVYTYDGTTTRVYADGALWNSEVLGPGVINTAPSTSINLATQLDGDGVTPTGGIRGDLVIARIRIHDGVLTDAQVLSNYNSEKADFINPLPPAVAKLSKAPIHRYSFSESPTDDASALNFADSIGGADGLVQGAGAKFTGTRMVLPGGGSDTAAYGDLPNGLLSENGAVNGGTGQVSLEGWVKVTGNKTWSRFFDIGSTTAGEITGPGGAANGTDYLLYSALTGADVNTHRLEMRNEDPPGGGDRLVDLPSPNTFNSDIHFVVTWDELTGLVAAYENGAQVGRIYAPTRSDGAGGFIQTQISDINDVNVWLGRSNWLGDQNAQAEFDEFRIYDHALSAGEVLGNFQTGPNTINDGEVAVSLVTSPTDQTAYDTYDATFSVEVAGTPPITYQWFKGNDPISGATSRVLHFLASPADSGAVYSCLIANTAQGTPHSVKSGSATLTVLPVEAPVLRNRYSFNQTAEESSVVDSVGGADGQLVGGAVFTGDGRVSLDGTSGYINLPNDLIMNYASVTLESWVQDDGSRGWARIFDFGNSGAGEDFTPGAGSAGGTQYLFLSQPSGFGNLRGAYTLTGGGGGEQIVEWVGKAASVGQLHHIVWTSQAEAHTGRLFVDGELVAANTLVFLTPVDLGPTQNDWLGRSQFNDPFFLGSFQEFRIWQGAMSPSQVAKNYADGPDASLSEVRLSIAAADANKVTLSWPASAAGFNLQSATSLGAGAVWSPVTGTPTPDGTLLKLTLQRDGTTVYFRLAQ